MNFNKSISFVITSTLLLTVVEAGTLKGHVKYTGKVKIDEKTGKPRPKGRPIDMGQDDVCGSAHSGPVYPENWKLDSDGSIADALVYLKKVPSYTGGAPEDPVVLNQKGCIYSPHVLGMVAGQDLLIKNSDPTTHNIHSRPKLNKEFNFSMPGVVKEKLSPKNAFEKTEPDPFYIKCDIHPWMKAWELVSDHPYFSVTDASGNFSIDGIPPGTYEVVCWQERFAKKKISLTETVTIDDGETNLELQFSPPPKSK